MCGIVGYVQLSRVNHWQEFIKPMSQTISHRGPDCSDSWFDEYVFEVVVDKKHLDQKVLNVLKTRPIVLKPWDPLGNLA